MELFGDVLNEQPGFNYSYDWTPSDLVSGNGANVTVDGWTEDTVTTLTVSVTGVTSTTVKQPNTWKSTSSAAQPSRQRPRLPDDALDLVALNFTNEGLLESDFIYVDL